MSLRPVSLTYFSKAETSIARGQNFTVTCMRGNQADVYLHESVDETILICALSEAFVVIDGVKTEIPARSIAILPAGAMQLGVAQGGEAFALTTGLVVSSNEILNAQNYIQPDSRVAPVGRPWQLQSADASKVRVFAVDQIPYPVGNGRLKLLQSATMSINWVEYDGPRDRSQLSPHAHEDFEQGSLAIVGAFVHHIRAPWGRNADEWKEDEHISASEGSLAIIPPQLIHTTEGIGAGQHVLIDVFAPVRDDFVAKDWVFNAADYERVTGS